MLSVKASNLRISLRARRSFKMKIVEVKRRKKPGKTSLQISNVAFQSTC
jgi:hypothetical protein